jgi:hypothetical protein
MCVDCGMWQNLQLCACMIFQSKFLWHFYEHQQCFMGFICIFATPLYIDYSWGNSSAPADAVIGKDVVNKTIDQVKIDEVQPMQLAKRSVVNDYIQSRMSPKCSRHCHVE